MILSTAGVESGPKSRAVVGELQVNTPLLLIFSAACNHPAQCAQTTDLTCDASIYILRLVNSKYNIRGGYSSTLFCTSQKLPEY